MIKDQLKRLLKLQEIDLLEDELNYRLKVISNKKEISIMKQTIESQEAELSTKCKNIDSLSREIRSLDRKLQVLDETLKQTGEKIYGGEINTVRELSQLQKKQDKLKKNVGSVEDNALKLMVEVEDLKESFTRDKIEVEQNKEEYKQKRLKKQEEIDKINEEMSRVKLEKRNLLDQIPSKLIDRYNRIKKLKKDAVASLSEGKCNGCRMEVSIMLVQEVNRGESLVYCENCGRLLV